MTPPWILRVLRQQGLWGLLSYSLFFLSLPFVFSSTVRTYWQNIFLPPERQILSVVSGELNRGGPMIRAVKILTPRGIHVEVYGPLENNVRPLIDEIFIPDRRDGYYHISSRPTNLALQDLDGNGFQELIIPTYDTNLVPRLNIFRYNEENKTYEPYTM